MYVSSPLHPYSDKQLIINLGISTTKKSSNIENSLQISNYCVYEKLNIFPRYSYFPNPIPGATLSVKVHGHFLHCCFCIFTFFWFSICRLEITLGNLFRIPSIRIQKNLNRHYQIKKPMYFDPQLERLHLIKPHQAFQPPNLALAFRCNKWFKDEHSSMSLSSKYAGWFLN